MPWLTPDSPAPADRFCRRISIPNDPILIQAISGALLPLTYPSAWEQSGTMTPDEAAEIMRTMLIEFFSAVGCPTVPTPYWDDTASADDESPAGDQSWYGIVQDFLAPIEGLNFVENAAVWAITGFVAYAAGPGAAVFFRTVAQRFVLAVQRQDAGELIRVVVDSAEYNIDTSAYAVGEIIEIPIVTTPAPTHDILVIGTGDTTRRIVRKRLSEAEMDAITDIQQVGGQLQIVRGNSGVWENVPNADNVRRDGSTIITGNQTFKAGSASGGAINVNPDAGQPALNIRLPVTTTHDVMRVLNNAGTTIYSVNTFGRQIARGDDNNMYSVLSADGSVTVFQVGTLAANPVLQLRGRAGQSGNLLNILASTGITLASVSASGALTGRGSLLLRGASSVQERDMALIQATWSNSTDAFRRSKVTISANDAGTWYPGVSFEADSILPGDGKLAFFDGIGSGRVFVTGDVVQIDSALDQLLSGLDDMGLIVDTATRYSKPTVYGENQNIEALVNLLDALSDAGIINNETVPFVYPTCFVPTASEMFMLPCTSETNLLAFDVDGAYSPQPANGYSMGAYIDLDAIVPLPTGAIGWKVALTWDGGTPTNLQRATGINPAVAEPCAYGTVALPIENGADMVIPSTHGFVTIIWLFDGGVFHVNEVCIKAAY